MAGGPSLDAPSRRCLLPWTARHGGASGPFPSGTLGEMRDHPDRIAERQQASGDVAVEAGGHGEDFMVSERPGHCHTPRGELAHTGANASSIGVRATLAA